MINIALNNYKIIVYSNREHPNYYQQKHFFNGYWCRDPRKGVRFWILWFKSVKSAWAERSSHNYRLLKEFILLLKKRHKLPSSLCIIIMSLFACIYYWIDRYVGFKLINVGYKKLCNSIEKTMFEIDNYHY